MLIEPAGLASAVADSGGASLRTRVIHFFLGLVRVEPSGSIFSFGFFSSLAPILAWRSTYLAINPYLSFHLPISVLSQTSACTHCVSVTVGTRLFRLKFSIVYQVVPDTVRAI